MRHVLSTLIVGICLLAGATNALADSPPTRWDRAKDPAAGDRYKLHMRAEQLLHQASRPDTPREKLLETARAELEKASAGTSIDLRLRVDLARVYRETDRYRQALDILRPALALAPRDASAYLGWDVYSLSAAKLDLSRDEIAGYDVQLALSLSPDNLNVIGNRAEAFMRIGQLDEAIDGYREVIDRCIHAVGGYTPETLALALWGLAVALDRNGESGESAQQANLAALEDPQERYIGDKDVVFFVPEYDRNWYLALGRTAHAKQQTNPEAAAAYWSLVVTTWQEFIKQGSKVNDRWLPLAKSHLAAAERESKAASDRWETMRRMFVPQQLRSPFGNGLFPQR